MSGARLLVAERFAAPDGLCELDVPLDVIAARAAQRLRFLVAAAAGPDHRAVTLRADSLTAADVLRLTFRPLAGTGASPPLLGVFALDGEGDPDPARPLAALRRTAAGRPPIRLDGRGREAATGVDPLLDDRAIAARRLERGGAVRVAHGLEVYWCDAHGLYLAGWVHAHEHRVTALRVASGGGAAVTRKFTDRPDLLRHYPEYAHARHAGFALYLACPARHPVVCTVETDAGSSSWTLALPAHPLPRWSEPAPAPADLRSSRLLRRFADLANGAAGGVLLVGARTSDATGGVAAIGRGMLRGRVIGLDIHPGHGVQVVGDAHGLSALFRPAAFGAVASGAVLEHLAAPWLLAAEINRVLAVGGVVYHQAPQSWPAHAQPNDFWRFTAAGLGVLFGPDTGFEVLEASDQQPAAMHPAPDWRGAHLAMPTVPLFGSAEIVARKVRDLPPGAIAWPLDARASAARARRYPVAGLSLSEELA